MTFSTSQSPARTDKRPVSIVLVHGAFVDASGWQPVFERLSADGYEVLVAQHPTLTLQGDVETTKRLIAAAKHPVVLVGHSYGGAIITEAGNDAKVQGLIYLAAFVPDAGESVLDLASQEIPGVEPAPLLPPTDGFIRVDQDKFPVAFAADVDPVQTHFMAAAQLPWGLDAVQGMITTPAWKTRRAFYLLATEDRMIPPQAQKMMAERAQAPITEIRSSHAPMLSQPDAVAAFIISAATSLAP